MKITLPSTSGNHTVTVPDGYELVIDMSGVFLKGDKPWDCGMAEFVNPQTPKRHIGSPICRYVAVIRPISK